MCHVISEQSVTIPLNSRPVLATEMHSVYSEVERNTWINFRLQGLQQSYHSDSTDKLFTNLKSCFDDSHWYKAHPTQ